VAVNDPPLSVAGAILVASDRAEGEAAFEPRSRDRVPAQVRCRRGSNGPWDLPTTLAPENKREPRTRRFQDFPMA